MIETARSIFRELVHLWEVKRAATYSALVTFLAVYYINYSRQLSNKLEGKAAQDNVQVYQLAKEKEALREENGALKDTVRAIQMRYNFHLEQDLKRLDTTRTDQ